MTTKHEQDRLNDLRQLARLLDGTIQDLNCPVLPVKAIVPGDSYWNNNQKYDLVLGGRWAIIDLKKDQG